MATTGYDTVIVVADYATGEYRIDGDPPEVVSWSPTVLDIIRRGECSWTTIDGDVITMNVRGGPVVYRLTGESDFGGGLVAVREPEPPC